MASSAALGTVLVVDDQEANRELLAAYLATVPCYVREARDGDSALAQVAAAQPDVILLDVTMPGLNGYAVTKRLKSDPRTATIPIVLLTSLSDRDARLRGLEVGADDFLTKPVDQVELLTRVRTLLRLKHLHDERESAQQRALDEALAALRESEEHLRQVQRLEAIGRLAGGVAHDFNNLLTVITGFSELLKAQLPPDDPLCAYVEEIAKAGDRAEGLTRQLLAFSRRQILAPEVLDLNLVVADMERMLGRLIGEDVELVVVRDPGLGRVRADPGQLQQVLLNLAVNARDAMPRGGRLLIQTCNRELDAAFARAHPPTPPGPYVQLSVTDSGQGIDAETQAHIFEPFFTTKEAGKGTGMGLATVYGIVKQSGGYIWVASKPGRGATFDIYLPRLAEAAAPAPAPTAPSGVLYGTETILLVEDEDQVRGLARRALGRLGYTVLEASHGAEALALVERHEGPIDLLITDVVMPGLGGQVVATRLAARQSGLRVLYVSGYPDDTIVQHGVLKSGTAFLQKPFTGTGLGRKVREVLDGPPGVQPP